MIRSPRSKHRAQRVYRPSLWRSRIPTERLFDSRPSPWRAWHSTHSMTIPDTSTPVPTTLVPIKKIIRPKGESSRSKQSGRGFDILEVTQLSSETWGEIKVCISYYLRYLCVLWLRRHLPKNDVNNSSITISLSRSRARRPSNLSTMRWENIQNAHYVSQSFADVYEISIHQN